MCATSVKANYYTDYTDSGFALLAFSRHRLKNCVYYYDVKLFVQINLLECKNVGDLIYYLSEI